MPRTDRGSAVGGQPFSDPQRLWLLERDMDEWDQETSVFRREVHDELKAIRRLVSSRLNVLVGVGFSLLLAIVSVLVTVIANSR